MWMRAQILGDLAAIAEDTKNPAEAERLYRQAVTMLEVNYPGSAALLNAQARLAGYLARNGQLATAEEMFRTIVRSQPDATNLPPSFAHVLRPYVDLLLKKGADPAANAEIFAATQLMVRPGLAQTQAVLARQLSGGTVTSSPTQMAGQMFPFVVQDVYGATVLPENLGDYVLVDFLEQRRHERRAG